MLAPADAACTGHWAHDSRHSDIRKLTAHRCLLLLCGMLLLSLLCLLALQLVGSRCGPMDVALHFMSKHAEVRQLLQQMLQHEVPLSDSVAAMSLAGSKRVLKVQLVMPSGTS